MKQRVSAVIIDGDKNLLLIKRIKPSEEYYVFPGGSVEAGESLDDAMLREINEELSVHANVGKLLFKLEDNDQENSFFEIESTVGVPKIGGPEKERSSADNQYHIEWINLKKFYHLKNIYPTEAKEKLFNIYLE